MGAVAIEFRLLGPLEVRAGDVTLELGRPKQQELFVLLLLHANHVLPRQRLIDELWGDDPPVTAVKAVQSYISRLRKLLPDGIVLTRAPGYLLKVEPEAMDLLRFERLVAEARSAEPQRAASLLREALALWRGEPLAEFPEAQFARIEAGRLEELRLAALEDRIDADLALGGHGELTAELEALVAEHPRREHLAAQFMLALYRAGRQADALAAYRDARAAAEELGLEPGPELRTLERQILNQDAGLAAPRERRLVLGPTLPGALVPAPAFPFVGRTSQLETLRSLLARAGRGEGGLVLIAGEAGGGKTRLLRELAHEAAAEGALVLYGGSDAAVSVPYQPLREWLDFLVRVAQPDALAQCLGDRAAILSQLVPAIGEPAVAPELDRHTLQSAICDALQRVSRAQPLVLVADDLHWADAETLHLLRRVAATAPEAPLLVLAAYRDRGEELGAGFVELVADLTRLDGVTRLRLGRLSTDEVRQFIGASTDAVAPAELASALAELTAGSPLVLCELWRDLRDSGAVDVSAAGVQLVRPLDGVRSPERLRDIVRQRLSRVAPETATMLALASVIGPRVELRLLAQATELDQKALAAALDEATRKGVLEELPAQEPACRFTHELVRRAVYDRIPGLDRIELHLRVGEALERLHAADLGPVLPGLAHHFTLAAPVAGVERAVDYNLRAANAALAAAAFEQGAARLSTALELGIADPRERARTQVELGYVLREMGRRSESDALLAASLDAATGLGERGIAARALLHRHQPGLAGDPESDPAQRRMVAEAAIETLAQLGDSQGLAMARRNLGRALMMQGAVGEATAVLELALADADASGDQATRRTVIGTLCHSLCHGPTPVREGILRCEDLLPPTGKDRVLEAAIGRFLSLLLAMAGRFDEARELVQSSSLVLDELNHTGYSVYQWAAADARELSGDHDGAARELASQWAQFREVGGRKIDERALAAAYRLAFLHCDEGRWDEAATALAFGREVLEVHGATAVFRLAVEARLAVHRGLVTEGLTLAQRVVESTDRTDYLDLRARAWSTLAEAQRAAGAAAEAGAAVAEAIRLYEAKGNVAAAASLRR